MKKTEESLRRLKKGKKTTFSLFGNAKDDDGRDEERIKAQMILDVEAFGKEAQSLGIDLTNDEHYESLRNVVLTSDRKWYLTDSAHICADGWLLMCLHGQKTTGDTSFSTMLLFLCTGLEISLPHCMTFVQKKHGGTGGS